jgi:hypothetical protein
MKAHNSIWRVMDSGTAPGGLPWYVLSIYTASGYRWVPKKHHDDMMRHGGKKVDDDNYEIVDIFYVELDPARDLALVKMLTYHYDEAALASEIENQHLPYGIKGDNVFGNVFLYENVVPLKGAKNSQKAVFNALKEFIKKWYKVPPLSGTVVGHHREWEKGEPSDDYMRLFDIAPGLHAS